MFKQKFNNCDNIYNYYDIYTNDEDEVYTILYNNAELRDKLLRSNENQSYHFYTQNDLHTSLYISCDMYYGFYVYDIIQKSVCKTNITDYIKVTRDQLISSNISFDLFKKIMDYFMYKTSGEYGDEIISLEPDGEIFTLKFRSEHS